MVYSVVDVYGTIGEDSERLGKGGATPKLPQEPVPRRTRLHRFFFAP